MGFLKRCLKSMFAWNSEPVDPKDTRSFLDLILGRPKDYWAGETMDCVMYSLKKREEYRKEGKEAIIVSFKPRGSQLRHAVCLFREKNGYFWTIDDVNKKTSPYRENRFTVKYRNPIVAVQKAYRNSTDIQIDDHI